MSLSIERLNLDEAFTFLYEKAAYEPVTPFRLAIYLLIRAVTMQNKEMWLTQSQMTELSFLIYSLLLTANLSFPELCRAIHEPLNRINQNIYKIFLESVDEYRSSVEVLIRKEELFLQSSVKRRRSSQASHSRDSQSFITPKSLLGVFIRKLALARDCQSFTELGYSHQNWLKWLSDERPSAREDLFGGYNAFFCFNFGRPRSFCGPSDDAAALAPRMQDICLNTSPIKDRSAFLSEELVSATVFPPKCNEENKEESYSKKHRNVFHCDVSLYMTPESFCINPKDPDLSIQPSLQELLSSARARSFIDRQIHLLHVSPEEAMSSAQLKAACAFIKNSYYDLPVVHLVLMLNAIRNRNPVEAEEHLRAFFDCCAIRTNERDGNGDVHLTSCDARPLRYAPLLLARLARLFNQSQRARHLLTEAVQHAHSNRDLVCLRLAIVEQAAIESEEEFVDCLPSSSERAFSPSLLLSMWGIQPKGTESEDEERENEIFNDDEKDGKMFTKQLRDCATLQNCIILSKKCEDLQQVTNGLQICAGADYGADRESQSRLMNEAARMVSASLKLSNGFIEAAISDSEALLHCNFGDSWCRKYNTEAHVIAFVNIVYAHAMNGRFAAASRLLQKAKSRFSLEQNQQCALHWKNCEALVEFDRSFLLGDWAEAEKWLESLNSLLPEEADLRKAVYLFTRGELRLAFDVVRARRNSLAKSRNLRMRLRCDMVLAMFYAYQGREHVGRNMLEECLALAKSHNLDNFAALISRRLAYIHVLEKNYDEALCEIKQCEWIINTRCSLLEKAHFAITAYNFYKQRSKMAKESESVQLSLLAAARNFYHRASAPLLEKNVLKLAAYEYNDLGQVELRDDCAIAYADINEKYPAELRWQIL